MPALTEPVQRAARSIREDLANYLAVVDAKSTPFTSMIPKGKELGNMQFDWQVDSYSPVLLGGKPDGVDISTAALTNASDNRARFSNYGQVFQRDFRVGFIAEQMEVAGVTDEVARSMAKRTLELKRDMEATLLLTDQPAVLDNGTVGYTTASLGSWLTAVPGAGAGKPTAPYAMPANSLVTGAVSTLDETKVQNILTSIFGETGQIRTYNLILGTTLKRAFTNLTGTPVTATNPTLGITATSVRTFNMDLDEEKFKHTVEVFQGDFGTLTLHPSVFIGKIKTSPVTAMDPLPTKGYVIPMEMTELRYVQLPKWQDLPDYGGGPAKLIRAIAGLVVKNPLGFGMFDMTT